MADLTDTTGAVSAAVPLSEQPLAPADATRRPVLVVDDVHIKYKTFGGRRRKKSRLPSWASGFGQGVGAVDLVHAVKGVSFVAHHGESIGLIGHNGSGKSTLLRAIAGALPVTDGAIYTDGIASLLGVSGALINSLSGERNIILGCLALGLKPNEVRKHYEEVVDFADIGEFIQLPMSAYSSGMGARLRFAISTAAAPDILMIDEALATGDAAFKARSQQRIDDIRSRAGTVLLVSHSMGSIKETCDRVLWLDSGVLRADGEPDEVIDAYLEAQAKKVAASKPIRRSGVATAKWPATPHADGTRRLTLVRGVEWTGTAPTVNGLQGAAFHSSALPDGMTLSDDGVLSGAPTTVGSTDVTLSASDGMQTAVDLVRFDVIAAPTTLVPVPPTRIMDTRPRTATNDGRSQGEGPLSEAPSRLPVLGRGPVPSTGVEAVVLNVTATRTKATSYLTVWASGEKRPITANVGYAHGQTVATSVVARVGADGAINIATGESRADVIVDVAGWIPQSGDLVLPEPARLLDTRRRGVTDDGLAEREGPVTAAPRDMPVAGRMGVPGDATAVLLTVTAHVPDAVTELTLWPAGSPQPADSTLRCPGGAVQSCLAIVPLGENGSLTLTNSAGSTDVLVDLLGWFKADASFMPLAPAELLDTRNGDDEASRLGPQSARHIRVGGHHGVPSEALGVRAVALRVTALEPTANGYLRLWPAGARRPETSNVNFAAGQNVANVVILELGVDGEVVIENQAGSTDVVVDIIGWWPAD